MREKRGATKKQLNRKRLKLALVLSKMLQIRPLMKFACLLMSYRQHRRYGRPF